MAFASRLWGRARARATATAASQSKSAFARQFTNYLIRYVSWLPPLIWFNTYVAQVTFINGPSMYPFLNSTYNESTKRDLCLVYKLYAQQNLERGMCVTFRSPTDPDKIVVKRIVGLEGDIVRTKPPYPNEYIRVPEGHIWVEGDGDKSRDSNYYGPISARLVTGQITHILLPFSKAGRVRWWEHQHRTGIQRAA
ncbi:LexA/Signal peptidase [Diplogelasinospora grovesii]|uniref:Mitochondrial inner membrane protease subunit 2 n=1 Tax=Diplogelasinospora grovesii TaxID=303347 RepID=A0AAN6NDK1_9PEZI|nr:LexA/Signal peptidase [Diplogelasinospora grovesii]